MSNSAAFEDSRFQKVKAYGTGPNDMTVENLANRWASNLPQPRIDIQTALTVIGERTETQKALERDEPGQLTYRLDLRNTNLRRADISNLDLSQAQLNGTHLEGADLSRTHLEGADLSGTHLEGAVLSGAHLEGADLSGAHLEGANLYGAHLEGARLFRAHLEGADLSGTHLEEANLYGAHLEGADLSGTHLEWANLSGTHLEGADLGGTHLEGADLGGAYLDGEISFAPAILRGAGARDINLEHIQCETFTEAFGDASVTLPDGYAAGEGKLSHWSPEKLDWENFYEAWRKWQAEQHPDLLPPYYTAED